MDVSCKIILFFIKKIRLHFYRFFILMLMGISAPFTIQDTFFLFCNPINFDESKNLYSFIIDFIEFYFNLETILIYLMQAKICLFYLSYCLIFYDLPRTLLKS